MRMPKDEFVADMVAHISNIEKSRFATYLGIENDVEQDVAEFLAYYPTVLAQQGVAEFVGFLYGVGAQALKGLFSVPGAFLAQLVHDVE